MLVRWSVALATAAALLAPIAAAAADLSGPPVFSLCGPPPAAINASKQVFTFKTWWHFVPPARITDVERYDPHHPPLAPVPTYVIPQTAYLASPLCDFPNGASDRSWYDGKVFYRPGGVHASPDTFMIIERR